MGCGISIIIKAWNEERHIGAALASSLAALEGLSGEVILADCGSLDRTVEVARGYPVTVVQLADPGERTCGIAAQMGFQQASGSFIYLLDGDMVLNRDFLTPALELLERTPRLAAVAGLLEELGGGSYEFDSRIVKGEHAPGVAGWLNGGGLYRREAIESVGYLTNRNLHACEEMELGLRLSRAGWGLRRLDLPALLHHGHTDATFALLFRRWRSGALLGSGELLRSAWGTPYFGAVLRRHGTLVAAAAGELLLAGSLVALPWTPLPLAGALGCWCAAYLLQVARKGGFAIAVYSMANVVLYAAGLVRGLLRRQVPPEARIACRVLSQRGNP